MWLYIIQLLTGFSIFLVNSWFLDIGMPSVSYFLWETFSGGFVSRFHSEFANVVFLWLYIHILMKIWTSAGKAQSDHTWFSGIVIFMLTYVAGITGAIMPLSILSQVTATVIGSAIKSFFIFKFSFFETLMIPGLLLNDETLVRVALIHYIFPYMALLATSDHIHNLHTTEYTDEDEMEAMYQYRLEYSDEFFWIEFSYWFEGFILYQFFKPVCDLLNTNPVSYGLSNFDYWPQKVHINFVIAVPHWYLRPLMSSLVVIPHHYLGFMYVIFFFFAMALMPSSGDGMFMLHDTRCDRVLHNLSNDAGIIFNYFYFLFIMAFIATTAVLPTGRYFMAIGGTEILTYAFWYILVYLFFLYKHLAMLNREYLNLNQ